MGRRVGVLATTLGVLAIAAVAGYQAAMAWLGPPPLAAAKVSSKLVVDRHGQLLRPFTTPDGLWRLPVTADEVDPRYVKLLLAYEDKRFYSHDGVDPRAALRAIWQFIRYRRPVSGASTLTMQTARLLDDRPTHSYLAKIGQIFRAWQLESMLSKREILELYMRLAPFGGNIEGVRAASLAYFGKEPRHLTVSEAALLVALPQSPEQRRPDRNAADARAARNRVIDRAATAGVITKAEAGFAKQQTLRVARYNFPTLAAHLSERLAASASDDVIKLTIDARLQQGVEAVVARHAEHAGPKLSAAAIVVDHHTGEILADVGSADYFDHSRNGSVDMTQAVRSPGSALKPFIYGLAFDAGYAHPETMIQDRPVRFGHYAPENFDNTYRGAVTVRQALQLSLNVPAVKMLAAIGPSRLAAHMRQAGFDIDVPRNLTVALGGVGLRLEQLAGLYTALARGGEPIPLRFLQEGAPPSHAVAAEPLLHAAAAWYVMDILRGAPPPAYAKGGEIAFKTGTSYGYRDAWAAGFDGHYAVAVWIGRPDATPTPGLTGITKAAPMLFDIFSQIGPDRAPFAPPPHGVIAASTATLPPPLANFREPANASTASAEIANPDPPVHIAFPPDRAELEMTRETNGDRSPIAFKAEGGVLPLTWLVNGSPIATAPYRREVFWTPASEGFVQLSVIDAQGTVDRVTVRLR